MDRPTILVVEDDPMALEMLRHALTRAGHEVEAAADGHEALAARRRLPEPAGRLLDLSPAGEAAWPAALARRRRETRPRSGTSWPLERAQSRIQGLNGFKVDLDEAKRDQCDRSPDADLGIGREEPDQDRRHAHVPPGPGLRPAHDDG